MLTELTKEFTYEIKMKMMRCEKCDSRFAISMTLLEQARTQGLSLSCPRGHKHKYAKPKPANPIVPPPPTVVLEKR